MSQTSEEKLQIIIGEKKGSSYSYGRNIIEGILQPETNNAEKNTNFQESKIPGLESPLLQFNQGDAGKLSFRVLLDTYCSDELPNKDLRREYIDKLEKLVHIDGEIHAPPPCKVVWGTYQFIGYVESFEPEYIMFTADGTPVRALVDITFVEYVPKAKRVPKQ